MHWYDATTGETRYKIPYANGKGEKTPTLADAKRLGFVPSVTSVLGILDKPGLNNWKVQQAILAALTHPGLRDDMTHEEMLRAINRDAQKQAKQAAKRGTAIHNAIELQVSCQFNRVPKAYRIITNSVTECLLTYAPESAGKWVAEARLPGGLGYGGKCDLHSDEWLIDFKTKEFTQDDIDAGKVKGWPEQHCQLVAYDHGFGGKRRRLANVFVSVTEPGLCHFYEWPEDQYDIGLRRWQTTLECWLAWKDPEGKLTAMEEAA